MKRRIIVPVNETTRSERAIPVAAAFARRLNASLTLVSVVTWPYAEHPGHSGYHEGLVKAYPDIEAESVVVRTLTDTAGAIESLCRPGDVICLGTDHTSSTAEVLLRSVFLDLVRTFHGPVIVVGPKAVMPDSATQVLICLDGNTHAEQGLALIPQIIEPAGFKPFLVQVTDSSGTADVHETNYLHELAHSKPSMHIMGWDVLHGHPKQAIASYANDPSIAAIAFTTDALDPVARLISPSLANELVAVANRPLILLGSSTDVSIARHLIQPGASHAFQPGGS